MAEPSLGNDFNADGILTDVTVHQSRERLARLLAEINDERHTSKDHLQRVLQELSSGLEELLVAEEELRTQAEELAASSAAIDAERERYGELFEFAPDAYLVTDVHGKILEANTAASRMLGVPARYLEGKLLISFASDSVRRDLRDLLAELARSGQHVDERYLRLQPREGPSFVGAVRAVSRHSPPSGTTVVRWMVRDITQRLRLEEEIRFLHSEVELLTSLGHVAQLTAEPQSIDSILDRVVEMAAQALPACEVSVALPTNGDEPRIAASSGARGRRLDAAEHQQEDGPCLSAIRQHEAVVVSASDCAIRWPVFGAAAQQVGLVSANSYPLVTPGGRRGALNVYAFGELSAETCALIPLLVDQVVVALTNAELYESAHSLAGHLQRALESRGVIEQAKGVLIARQGCTDEQAFDILRRASQRLNRKLREVAADLVAHVQTGEGKPAHPDEAEPHAIAPPARGRDRDHANEARRRAEAPRLTS